MTVAIIAAAVLTIFLIRLTGYPRLARHDERVSAYVLDAVQNGNWIVQKDLSGDIASKPPLLTWGAAVATLLTGRVSRFTIHLPAAVSLFTTAIVLLAGGRRMFGWRAGFFAAFVFVVSPAGYNQLAVARYDGLLALMVILAALAAFRAWLTGTGWTWFWLAAAIGTLAKGPLAVVLGAAGLLAAVWERRTGLPVRLRGYHFIGLLAFTAIAGGWFVLAYRELGQPLIAKMIGRELIGHAVGSADESSPLGPLKPPIDFAIGFAPWSLVALLAFWRVCKQPDRDITIRRFERFLLCGFLVGLIIFCCAGHHKSRLIVPLLPFAALLVGRELAEFTLPWSSRRIFRAATLVISLFALGAFLHVHYLLKYSPRVQETLGAREVSRRVVQRLGVNGPLTFADSPSALQFYLNNSRPPVSFERAAALLRGKAAAWVAVSNFGGLEKQLGPDAQSLHEVARWPVTGQPLIRIVGNQPLPMTNQATAILLGPLRVETESLQLERQRISYRRGMELDFRGNATNGILRIENQGDAQQTVRVRIIDEASTQAPTEGECTLLPGTVWEFPRIHRSTES